MEELKELWPGWRTVRLIGHGSYGAVYEIEREQFSWTEKAALKYLHIPQGEGDIEEMRDSGYDDESITASINKQLEGIVNEYRLMRTLNGSANIVSYDDVRYIQQSNGFGWDVYIKMELLTPLLKSLPADIPVETAVRVGIDICKALELCAKNKIVHRDIKPQNIFISDNGDYKLGDFGIARTMERTMGGTKTGTYKYMAPEVYNNRPYGQAADIYSLGMVLYFMLNERRMPFMPLPPAKVGGGMDDNALLRRMQGEPVPAPLHGSEILKAVVLKACAFDPNERYHTAAEMREALEQAVSGTGAKAAVGAAADAAQAAAPVVESGSERVGVKGHTASAAHATAEELDDDGGDYVSRRLQAMSANTGAKERAADFAQVTGAAGDHTVGIRDSVTPVKPAAEQDTDATAVLSEKNTLERRERAEKAEWEKQLERQYQSAAALMNNAADVSGFEKARNALLKLNGYRDSAALAEKCTAAIARLQAERQRRQAEQPAKKSKKGIIIGVIAAAVVAAAIVLVVVLGGKGHALPRFSKVSVGNTITFGSYEQDGDTTNGKEAIEWIVLAKQDNRVLVISKYALDCQQYNTDYTDVTWGSCTLRTWLNSTFLNAAFTEAEQACIPTVTVTADKNPEYSTSAGNDTQDQVFLLSITEAEKYFSTDDSRMCVPTAYAIAQGAYTSSSYTVGGAAACWWWLRSPGYDSGSAASVNSVGSVSYVGNYVHDGYACVRPALWIDLGS